MIAVLGIVVLLATVTVFALSMAGKERREAAKSLHNITIQQLTESTLQLARNFFATHYGPGGATWNSYLAYFVANPLQLDTATNIQSSITSLFTAHPELFAATPTGYSCFMYARDNVDELPPAANDPTRDNDLLIYVGAVCVETAVTSGNLPLMAELTAPLLYNPTANIYRS